MNDQADDGSDDEVWANEEELHFAGIDERLWSDHDLKQQPPPPGETVDKLADEVEIQRLLEMKVLVKPKNSNGEKCGHLTTKFVRDWAQESLCEFQWRIQRKMDEEKQVGSQRVCQTRSVMTTFSPATGAHTSNLLPVFLLGLGDSVQGLQ